MTGRSSLPTSGLTSLPPSQKYSKHKLKDALESTHTHAHASTCTLTHSHTVYSHATSLHAPHCTFAGLHTVRLHTRFQPSLPCLPPFTLAFLPHLSCRFVFSVHPSFLLSPSLRPCIPDSLCLSLCLCLPCCSLTLACISFLGPNYPPTQDSPCLGIH